MCEIEIKLIKLISLFDYLIYLEDFGAYKTLLKLHKRCLLNLKGKQVNELIEEDFEPLINVFRIYMEAPPSDSKLGKYILDMMQEFYELQERVLKQNAI